MCIGICSKKHQEIKSFPIFDTWPPDCCNGDLGVTCKYTIQIAKEESKIYCLWTIKLNYI